MINIFAIDNFQPGFIFSINILDNSHIWWLVLNILIGFKMWQTETSGQVMKISNSTFHSICKAEPLFFMETDVEHEKVVNICVRRNLHFFGRYDTVQDGGIGSCPEVSPKFWRFIGCRKLTINLIFWILRCSVFRICIILWGLKWTVWSWENIISQKTP